jgi:hypothetical protein
MWFTIEGHGRRGLATLMAERVGRPLAVTGWSCPAARTYGINRAYAPCVVHRQVGARDTVGERLFGVVVERDGRFKLLNLSTGL